MDLNKVSKLGFIHKFIIYTNLEFRGVCRTAAKSRAAVSFCHKELHPIPHVNRRYVSED